VPRSTSSALATYGGIATLHSRHWDGPPREFFRVLDHLLFERLRPGARVLDLCCGAGHLAAALAECGYAVTGLDASLEMVRHARARVPRVPFAVADARAFSLRAVFDAVVCTFDGVNHLTGRGDLRSAFASVARALVPGGTFVFDALGEAAYEGPWRRSATVASEGTLYAVRGGYAPARRLAWTEISPARGGGNVVRIEQRCHEPRAVEDALTRAGLALATASPASAVGLTGDLAVGRTVYVATRPGA